MGGLKKPKNKGEASLYLPRGKALSRLNLSLTDFRRLCILKGVYPRDPKKKLYGPDKTYYHLKDLKYIQKDPITRQLRLIGINSRKIQKALNRREPSRAKSLVKHAPTYTLHHIIRERYPCLLDALRDLDDAVSMLALFAALPVSDHKEVKAGVISESTILLDQFLQFAARTGALRKIFVSVKGFYYEVVVLGQPIVFLAPHQFTQHIPVEVDFQVMLTFLEFYQVLVKFVNFKLYQLEGFEYPPQQNKELMDEGGRFLSLHIEMLRAGVRDGHCSETHGEEEAADDKDDGDWAEEDADNQGTDDIVQQMKKMSKRERTIKGLFKNRVVFISREVPRIPIALAVISCGGQVGWHGATSPFREDDTHITHHIVDRPPEVLMVPENVHREYVQPQWVFDSLNNCHLLPIEPYEPGKVPPPHLSPFVDDSKQLYIPQQRKLLDEILAVHESRKEHENQPQQESEGEASESDVEEVTLQEKAFHKSLDEENTGGAEANYSTVEQSVTALKKTKKEASRKSRLQMRKSLLSSTHRKIFEDDEKKKKEVDTAAKALSKKRKALSNK